MTSTMNGTVEETVRKIVRDDLAEFYKKEFEVVVQQAEAILDDQRYLQIYIVFDGTAKDLWIPGWTTGLIGRIRDKLADENIMEFPVVSPVAKSEWPALQRTIA